MKRIAIYGGTFNPVHNGHLQTAIDLSEQLGFDEVRLVPCYQAVHREDVSVSAEARLTMLESAVAGLSSLKVDDIEIRREGASYMFDTLAEIRESEANASICLVMGTDAFQKFNQWYRWDEFLHVANILVIQRPHEMPHWNTELNAWMKQYQQPIESAQTLKYGAISFSELTQLAISSTEIRNKCQAGHQIDCLVPVQVKEYIMKNGLYQ